MQQLLYCLNGPLVVLQSFTIGRTLHAGLQSKPYDFTLIYGQPEAQDPYIVHRKWKTLVLGLSRMV